jgi:DNA mismatch repair protein MutL
VAHERILYEKALKDIDTEEQPVVQQLLFPVNIDLSPDQQIKVEEYERYFIRMGFSIRILSGNSLVVDGVPAGLKDYPVRDMMLEIIEAVSEPVPEKAGIAQHFAKSFACGAAIKAGRQLSLEEMNSLVDLLFQCENHYTCPHGRPIWARIPLTEIDRRFLR